MHFSFTISSSAAKKSKLNHEDSKQCTSQYRTQPAELPCEPRTGLPNCRAQPAELHDVVVVLPSAMWTVPLEAHGHAYVLFEHHRCLQAAPKTTKSCILHALPMNCTPQQHCIVDRVRGHGKLHPKAKKKKRQNKHFSELHEASLPPLTFSSSLGGSLDYDCGNISSNDADRHKIITGHPTELQWRASQDAINHIPGCTRCPTIGSGRNYPSRQ